MGRGPICILSMGMVVCLAVIPAITAEANQRAFNNLKTLLAEAEQHNPQILSAKAEWHAAQSRVWPESWIDNPRFSYTYFGESIQTRVGPQEQVFGVSQKLPLPNKLLYRSQMARAAAHAAEQRYLATRFEVLTQVKQAYYQLFWLRKAIEITEQDKSLLEHFEQVAGAHFAAHAGKQKDVSKAQVEVSKVIDRLLMLRRQEHTLQAKLAAWVNLPDLQLGEMPEYTIPSMEMPLETLLEEASRYRQELAASEFRLEGVQARQKLARWKTVPDVTVGFNLFDIGDGTTNQPNDGEDAWNVMFSIEVPLWQQNFWAERKAARAETEAAEAALTQTERQVEFEVIDAFYAWETSNQTVELYRTAVIPQAEQALDTTEAAYRAGEADFLSLLDSERVWLNAQLTYWRSAADAVSALASLERAIGSPLVAIEQ